MTYLATEAEDLLVAIGTRTAAAAFGLGAVRDLAEAIGTEAEAIMAAGTAGDRLAALTAQVASDFPDAAAIGRLIDALADLTATTAAGIAVLGSVRLGLAGAIATALPRQVLLAVEDAEALSDALGRRFASIEDDLAGLGDGEYWQALNGVDAAVAEWLAGTMTVLPRRRTLTFGAALPSLVLAWRFYQDSDRSDELETENAAVHPAFMPLTIQALSA